MVHSDCTVYIALPSPSSASTFRSGAAIAAPIAVGSPKPIAPPVPVSQSWGAVFAVGAPNPRPLDTDSSTTIACSGISAATTRPMPSMLIAPSGAAARSCHAMPAGASVRAPTASASAASVPSRSCEASATSTTRVPGAACRPRLSGYAKKDTGSAAPISSRLR